MSNIEMTPEMVFKNTVFFVLAGSHLYGTNTEESDFDFRGITVPPFAEYYYGFHRFDQHDPKSVDLAIFDLRKFVQLAAACNPNIIELLFVPQESVIFTTPVGDSLQGMRELFLSRKARHTFTGYAHSQLNRIKNHKKWIDNPPSKPDRQEMGLPIDCKVVSPDKLDAARSLRHTYFSEEMWSQIQLEVDYRVAKREWDSYHSWKTNRNPKRYEMECEFGYDGKHAMHLVRLLRMGYEIISTGQVIVRRPDAEELLEIRNGSWEYEYLLEYAAMMDAAIAESEADSPLPWGPDIRSIEDWLVATIESYLERHQFPGDRTQKIMQDRCTVIEEAIRE